MFRQDKEQSGEPRQSLANISDSLIDLNRLQLEKTVNLANLEKFQTG
jgi:hypothetical protein